MKRFGANGRHSVSLVVNGTQRRGEAEPRMLLSDFLRHEIGIERYPRGLRTWGVRCLHSAS